MPKPTSHFVCQSCGSVHSKWAGRCDACGQWNALVEEAISHSPLTKSSRRKKTRDLHIVDLDSDSPEPPRMVTAITEFDRVAGGGLVTGSALLVGGDPGIGKSTLLLQVVGRLAELGRKVVYISGEHGTWKCAELKLYVFPSAGGCIKKKKRRTHQPKK